MNAFVINGYKITTNINELPISYEDYVNRAQLVDKIDEDEDYDDFIIIYTSIPGQFPFLIINLRFSPYIESCFYPDILLVPETDHIFIGAGERILIYDLKNVKRIGMDKADTGFLEWRRYKDLVIMIAELEIACWSVYGQKLWSRFVEPPFDYEIDGDIIYLDIMGEKSVFNIYEGPSNHK